MSESFTPIYLYEDCPGSTKMFTRGGFAYHTTPNPRFRTDSDTWIRLYEGEPISVLWPDDDSVTHHRLCTRIVPCIHGHHYTLYFVEVQHNGVVASVDLGQFKGIRSYRTKGCIKHWSYNEGVKAFEATHDLSPWNP